MRLRSFVLTCSLLLLACRAQIHHGLDEKDANEIVSVLVDRGFDARKVAEKAKKPSWAIEVDERRATDAVRVLAELKLPRAQRTTTRDVATQTTLIETPTAEKLRQTEALEGDLEQTLETMDGVMSAAVELVVPVAQRFGQPPASSKASALVRVSRENFERLQQLRDPIKSLIAGSVDGLKADDVALVIDMVEPKAPLAAPGTDELRRVTAMALGEALVISGLVMGLCAMGLRVRHFKRKLHSHGSVSAIRAQPSRRLQAITGPRKAAA